MSIQFGGQWFVLIWLIPLAFVLLSCVDQWYDNKPKDNSDKVNKL